MSDRPLQVLYVAGVPRSGSTLTDLMLDQLPGHVGVGELHYLWRNGVLHNNLCACGARFHDCPFWAQVGHQAFGGWSRQDAEEVIGLQDSVDRTVKIPRLLLRHRDRGFRADLDAYSDVLRRVYRAVLDTSGAEVVVDSSKRPSMAYVLRSMPDVELYLAHVVRDPRGVANSFAKHVALPEGVALRDEMPRSSTRKVARRWVTVNLLFELLAKSGVPTERVLYEDLVSDPRRHLGRVLALTSKGATSSLDFVTDGSVTIPESHLLAAGRIRLERGTVALKLDDAWRNDMPPGARRAVTFLTVPLRLRYGYR
jgi:hypothetical protein